jgi:uncharacterized membrane protein
VQDDRRGDDLDERARAAGLPPLHGARPAPASTPAPAERTVTRRIAWRGGRVAVAAAAVLATAGLATGLWIGDASGDDAGGTPSRAPASGSDGLDGGGDLSPAAPGADDPGPGFAVPAVPEMGPGDGIPDGGSGAS